MLGDSAYPCYLGICHRTKTMVPVFLFTKKRFDKQRVAIENCCGLLKQQRTIPCLCQDNCAVLLHCYGSMCLHNMCNSERDFIEELADLPARRRQ